MNDQILKHADTLQLLETGELITEREYRQREAAQAFFRTRLLGEVLELQNDLMNITHAANTAVGRRKF